MNLNTEEKNELDNQDYNLNDHFDIESLLEEKDHQSDIDLSEYDGLIEQQQEQQQEVQEQEVQEQEEQEEEDFNFENTTEEEKIDLAVFNKKFNKNFETEQELKNFLNGRDQEEEEKNDDESYEQAETRINAISPLLELSYADLIRRSINHNLMEAGKDLSDQEVQIEAEEKFQLIVDNNQLDLRGQQLQAQLRNVLNDAQNTKTRIDNKRTELKSKLEKEEAQLLQDKFVELYNSKSFYGIKPDKESIGQAYRDVKSGTFEKEVLSDKGTKAELALLWKFRKEIFKKATGLTHSDGIKSVMDEFQDTKTLNQVAGAQTRGTAGSPDATFDLISDVLRESPQGGN